MAGRRPRGAWAPIAPEGDKPTTSTLHNWGLPEIRGYHLGGLKNKDYSILGSILGSLYFVTLPIRASTLNLMQPRVEALNPDPKHTNLKAYSPPQVDRIWGIWGSYYNIPKVMFYNGDYKSQPKLETPSVKALNATSHHLEPFC